MRIIKISLFITLINLIIFKISNAQTTYSETGNASYYASKFHGRKTASGEKYDKNALTAAHNKLPFNTYVKVTNLSNHKSVIVKINDRGPFSKKRIIDLSNAAAEKIGLIQSGVAKVKIEAVTEKEIEELKPTTEVTHIDHTEKSLSPGKTYNLSGNVITPKGYGVQLISFSDEDKLHHETEKLKDKIKNLYIEVSTVNSTKVYRLISGNFPDKKSAQNELARLKAEGYDGLIKKFK